MSLSDKRIVYSNASGRELVRYEEQDLKEFIKDIKGDLKKRWESKRPIEDDLGFVMGRINARAGEKLA